MGPRSASRRKSDLSRAVRRFDQEKGWNIMAIRLCRENHHGQVERSRASHLREAVSLCHEGVRSDRQTHLCARR